MRLHLAATALTAALVVGCSGGSPVASGDHLYGVDGNSNSSRTCKVVCMDWATGEVKWEHRGLGCGSLLIADGKLILLGDKGTLVTAEATPQEYREISRTEALAGKCWTVPVLARGRIYCRNAAGDLVCLDVRK